MNRQFRLISLLALACMSVVSTVSKAVPGTQTLTWFQRYEDASYQTSVQDLSVKVLGGYVTQTRNYKHGYWEFNPQWAPLFRRRSEKPVLEEEPPEGKLIPIWERCPTGWETTPDKPDGKCLGERGSTYPNQVREGFQFGPRMFPFSSVPSAVAGQKRVGNEKESGDRIELSTTETEATWYSLDGSTSKYVRSADNLDKYYLTESQSSSGVKLFYDRNSFGDVTAVRDHFGVVALSFTYDARGRLVSVKSRDEREVRYEWTPELRLSRVVDSIQGVWSYGYDREGRLTTMVDPLNRTTSIAQLIGVNPLGHPIPLSGNTLELSIKDGASSVRFEQFVLEYAFPSGTLRRTFVKSTSDTGFTRTEIRDGTGQVVEIQEQGETVYREQAKELGGLTSSGGGGCSGQCAPSEPMLIDARREVSDVNGRVTVTYSDPFTHLVKRVVHPDGAEIKYEYQPGTNWLTQVTDALGRVTRYTYDAKGNLTKTAIAAGTPGEKVFTNTYDAYGYRIKETEVGNLSAGIPDVSTSYAYDAFGNTIKVTNAQGKVTTYTYDSLGNKTSVTDATGRKWLYTYDAVGNLLSSKDPANATYSYTYDIYGRLLKSTNAFGKETTYLYDGSDYLREVKNPDGGVGKYLRRSDGVVKEIWDEAGRKILSVESDPLGRTLSSTDAGGNQTSFEYDYKCSGGCLYNPSKITTPTYNATYKYDLRNRPRFENLNLSEEETLTTETRYDKLGRVLATRLPNLSLTTISYDDRGNVKSVTDTDGKETTFSYDLRNNLVALTDANGNATTYVYDSLDRLTSETTPQGRVTKYAYDALNRVASVIDPKNQKITYEYSLQGYVSKEKHFATATATTPLKTITYTRDIEGQLTGWSDGSFSSTCSYDDMGRNTGCTTNYGAFEKSFSYEYNLDGRKKSFTGPDGQKILFAYDSAGRLSGITNSAGVGVTYSEFVNNAPTKVTYPNGLTRNITYSPLTETTSIRTVNSAGDVVFESTQTYDKIRNVVTKGIDGETSEYAYDGALRLTSAKRNGIERESYTYDPLGNRLTDAGANLTYNKDNELLTNGDTTYTYDANGNLTSKTESGVVTVYKYDTLDRLVQVESPTGTVVARYGYDAFSRRLWKEVSGVKTWFFYAHEGLGAEFTALGDQTKSYGWMPNSLWSTSPVFVAGANKQWNYFQNDAIGTPQKLFDPTGKLVWAAAYTAFGKALVLKNDFPVNLRLAGQYFDEETWLHYNWNRYYDTKVGRYITRDPAKSDVGRNTFDFVQMNPAKHRDPRGLEVTTIGGSMTFSTPVGGATVTGGVFWGKNSNGSLVIGTYNSMGSSYGWGAGVDATVTHFPKSTVEALRGISSNWQVNINLPGVRVSPGVSIDPEGNSGVSGSIGVGTGFGTVITGSSTISVGDYLPIIELPPDAPPPPPPPSPPPVTPGSGKACS